MICKNGDMALVHVHIFSGYQRNKLQNNYRGPFGVVACRAGSCDVACGPRLGGSLNVVHNYLRLLPIELENNEFTG